MATEVPVPDLGESVVEATVGKWLKQEGDPVAVGDVLVELQTDKVDLEVGAKANGVLARIERQEGEDVAIGDVLAVIEEGDAPQPQETPAATEDEAPEAPPAATGAEQPAPAEPESSTDGEKATPVARRLAEAEGIPLDKLTGSGSGGRITKQDVQSYRDQQPAAEEAEVEKQPAVTTPPHPSTPSPAPSAATDDRRTERVRMSRRRRTIASRLVEAQQTAAMLTTFNEIDMSAVMSMRQRRKQSFEEEHGVRLGFMSFFVKAVVGALKAFPRLNAEIDGDEFILKHYYDIGIAVGAEEGLVVPVVRDAGRLNFAEIERQIRELARKATDGNLALDDLRGGTFTITNGGVFGSMLSTPILNPPQVGILGMHNIVERPVVVEGEVHARPIMYVALTYDHRLVDGSEAVRFLVKVKNLIEDPEELLLEG